MWLKGAREYYVTDDDLIGVFPPEALGIKPGPDALSVVVRGRGGRVKNDPVPFRSVTFAGRLESGELVGVMDMRTG